MSMESIYKLSLIVNMIDRLSGPAARINSAVGSNVERFQEWSHSMAKMATDGTVLIGTGQQLVSTAMAPVKATFDTQDALAELASLGVEDLGAVEQAAKSFSDQWAGASKTQIISAAYDIKSGIASLSDEAVADFTTLAALTAKATKSTVGEMTGLMATGYGIYKGYYADLTDLEFGQMFSAGIAQSVRQYKTTGSGMSQAISSLGGSATAANVPLEEQLAILGMLQATMSGSEAGTKYTAFLANAGKAGQELGLQFTDVNGQLRSMPEILGQIKGRFGEVLTASDKLELQKAFGTIEAVKLIELLYGKTGELQDGILNLYDTMGKGASITEEMANTINAPPSQQWQILKQQLQNVAETVGNAMLPQFTQLMGVLGDAAGKFASFVEQHPKLASGVMYLLAFGGGVLMAAGALKLMLGFGGSSITMLIGLWTKAKNISSILKDGAFYLQYFGTMGFQALKPLGTGFLTLLGSAKASSLGLLSWAKNGIASVVAATPGFLSSMGASAAAMWTTVASMLPIVIGIGLVIAALYLLYRNWDTVSAGIKAVWDWAVNGIQGGIDWIRTGIGNMVEWLTQLPQQMLTMGQEMVRSFVDGILSVANHPVEAVKGIFGKIRDLLPHSDAKTGPLSDLTLSGMRTMTTYANGIQMAAEAPADAVSNAFAAWEWPAPPTAQKSDSNTNETGKQTIIQKLILQVSLKEIEELRKLKSLLEEIEDETNSSGEQGNLIPERVW